MMRRLWSLYRPHLGWLLGGAALGLLTLLANVGLLALSGWFLSAMAAAGLAGASLNYFTPAAIIRGLAMLRTAGRYGERLVTHEATFRLIARLRTWLYQRLEPLAPAALEDQHSGELLNRLQKDMAPRRFEWNSPGNLCQITRKIRNEEPEWTATRYCFLGWV